MEMNFTIQKCSQVFNRVGTGYRGLTKFVLVDQYVLLAKGITLVLAKLSFIKLGVHQPRIESISDSIFTAETS
jgi:hypothetical protein